MQRREPGKLGRIPGVCPIGSQIKLSDYLVNPFPPQNPNATVDNSCGVTEFGMLGNDTYGDCGPAGDVHTCMITSWQNKEQPIGNINDTNVWPTAQQVVNTYMTYDGNQDNGVMLGAWLLYRMKTAIGPLDPIGGFAQIDDFGEMYEGALATFGAVYTGILVSSEMMNEYSNGEPWTSTSTDWIGAHCDTHIYRSPNYGKAITWGTEQLFTWENWRATREEAYAIFTPAQMNAPGGVWKNINVSKLKADLVKLGGSGLNS